MKRGRFSYGFVAAFLVRYGARLIKNSAKRLLRRPVAQADDDLAFNELAAHWLKGGSLRHVTCRHSHHDGGGAQAFMALLAINFARMTGLSYVHSPFERVAHADRPMADWAAAWEAQFNIGLGEVSAPELRRKAANFVYTHAFLLRLFGLAPDDLVAAFADTLPDLRSRFYAARRPAQNDVLRLCVHVRRGDVGPDLPDLWTEMDQIAATLTNLRSCLDDLGRVYRVEVISQGSLTDFAALEGPFTTFHLDGDAIASMNRAIEADVFIMAKGCFSWVAGLYCDGIKLCEERRITTYPGPQDWLRRAPDGSFDRARLVAEIGRLAPMPHGG